MCFRVLKEPEMDMKKKVYVMLERTTKKKPRIRIRIGLKKKLGWPNLNHSHSLIATMRNCSLGWSVTNLSIHCVLHRLLLLSTQIWVFSLNLKQKYIKDI